MAKTQRVCPVPPQRCSGATLDSGPGGVKTGGRRKVHASPSQVLDCERRYLREEGYEQLSPHDYRPPDGGPVMVLSRSPGAIVRTGKAGRRMADFHGGIVAW